MGSFELGAEGAAAIFEGQGLHTGARARVRLVREAGPARLRAWGGGAEVRIGALAVGAAARSTSVEAGDGRLAVRTVEHLFAALAALPVYEGVVVEIDGPEIPLVDGGARAFLDALERLGVRSSPPPLVVRREASIEIGASRYDFAPGLGRELEVEVDFGDARLDRAARWDGSLADFRERIAPARTFGFEREIEELMARGLASHVAPESVVVIGHHEIFAAGRPFEPDEPARHKLLDLIGDLYAHGGPPLGRVRARRPGHAATHEAVRRALVAGALERVSPHA